MARRNGPQDARQVVFNLQKWEKAAEGALRDELQHGADTVKQRMKTEHRWKNQTGAAEQNLDCQVFEAEGAKVRLIAFHGVPYGVHLETMQAGRLQVLYPTLRSEWPRILANMARAAKAVAGG